MGGGPEHILKNPLPLPVVKNSITAGMAGNGTHAKPSCAVVDFRSCACPVAVRRASVHHAWEHRGADQRLRISGKQ